MSMDPNQGMGGQGAPPPEGGPGYPPPPPPGYPPPQGYPPPPGAGYPPPPGAGYPPPGAGYPPPMYGAPQVAVGAQAPVPAGIGNIFQKWRNVTTKPGAQSFANELPTANWADVWIALLILGVITAITGFIRVAEGAAVANQLLNNLPAAQREAFSGLFSTSAGSSIASIITVPIGFFIGMGIIWIFAKIFGGTGTFLHQSYAFSLFYVPIAAVSAIVGIIPFLGGLAGFALFIYSIVLAVYSVMASQHLTGGKATAVVLLPGVIVLLLVCALVFVLAAVLFSAVQNLPPDFLTPGP